MAAMMPLSASGAAADPRLGKESDMIGNYSTRELKSIHDPSVTFDEYIYHARISRAEEDRSYGKGSDHAATKGPLQTFVLGKIGHKELKDRRKPLAQEKTNSNASANSPTGAGSDGVLDTSMIPEEEWLQASRAARTASWGAIFYLITTDILGPYTAPWALSQLGYGPGISLYTIFGVLAWYSGYQIWQMYIALDSDRYPLKGYGDIAFRIFGSWARHIVNVLQSFQFFLNVALLIIGSGE